MSRSSTRAKRNQQILALIFSLLVVVSMGVSLVATLGPQPTQATPTPPIITLTAEPLVPPTLTPTPQITPTATTQ